MLKSLALKVVAYISIMFLKNLDESIYDVIHYISYYDLRGYYFYI